MFFKEPPVFPEFQNAQEASTLHPSEKMVCIHMKRLPQTSASDGLPFRDERVLEKMISVVPETLRIVISMWTGVVVILGS